MALSFTKAFAAIALLHAPLQARASSSSPPPLSSNGQEWVSLSKNVEFLPASLTSAPNNLHAPSEDTARSLRRAQERVLSTYSSQTFAEGASDSHYSEYATAWRLLGVYIDCGSSVADAEQRQRRDRRHRVLEEDADENEDEADDDGGQQEQQYSSTSCPRYLLWEAYVDLDYKGGGLEEYKLFNPATKEFDLTSCSDSSGKRCVKMDCHMPNTHFHRLGTFKEYGVYDFLEQLVTYQGSCSWSEEQYSFASTYELFPQGCTLSSDGSSLYYDIRPNSGGKFSIGLYTDSLCTVNYKGSKTVEAVLQASIENYNNGDDDGSSSQALFASEDWFQQWNEALDVFKTCQPCMTVDVVASSSSRRARGRRYLNDDAQCQAGINQCAMFAENTVIYPASFRDVRLATQQGSVVSTHALSGVSPNRFKVWWTQWGFFTMSILVFFIGLVAFCCLVKVKKRPSLREPLLDGGNRNGSTSSRTVNSGRSKGKSSQNNRSSRTM